MPAEGPNQNDERLQRYAKERRAQGGDFSLHPATRRLLQGEVARQFGTAGKSERSWTQWFVVWRARLALGGTVAVVLLIGLAILWNGQQQSKRLELAKADVLSRDSNRLAEEKESNPRSEPFAAEPAPRQKLMEENVALRRARQLGEPAKKEAATQATFEIAQATPAPTATAPVTRGLDEFYSATASTNASVARGGWGSTLAGVSGTNVDRKLFRFGAGSSNEATLADLAATGGVGYGITSGPQIVDNTLRYYSIQPGAPTVALKDEMVEKQRVDLAKVQPERLAIRPTDAPLPADAASLAVVTASTTPPASQPLNDALAAANKPAGAVALSEAAPALAKAPALPKAESVAEATLFFRQVAARSENDPAAGRRAPETLQRMENADRPSSVLEHFTVEQRGRNIRIVEPDGSRYEGDIETPLSTEVKLQYDAADRRDKDAGEVVREQGAQFNESKMKRLPEYSFRASGTNVTLKQLIVVNGRFIQPTNDSVVALRGVEAESRRTSTVVRSPAPTAPAAPAGNGGAAAFSKSARFVAGAMTNRPIVLEGTVRIGATNVQRLKAESRTP